MTTLTVDNKYNILLFFNNMYHITFNFLPGGLVTGLILPILISHFTSVLDLGQYCYNFYCIFSINSDWQNLIQSVCIQRQSAGSSRPFHPRTHKSCSQINMFISKNETMCKVQKPGNSKQIIHVSNIHIPCQLHNIRHKSILLGRVDTKKANEQTTVCSSTYKEVLPKILNIEFKKGKWVNH